MNKARITYRFDQDKEKFDRLNPFAHADNQGTGPTKINQDMMHHDSHQGARKNDRNDVHTSKDHQALYDSQMLNQFTTDYGAWSSPFDIETERLEKLIRDSSYDDDDSNDREGKGQHHDDGPTDGYSTRVPEEAGVRRQREAARVDGQHHHDDGQAADGLHHVDRSIDGWDRYSSKQQARPGSIRGDKIHDDVSRSKDELELVDGFSSWTDEKDQRLARAHRAHTGPIIEVDEQERDTPIIEEGLTSSYSTVSYRSGGTSWFRIIISVAGAIVTGVLFGLFIMQMFTNLAMDPVAPPVSTTQDQQDGQAEPSTQEQLQPQPEGAIAVNVPQQTVYMLQFGVFSTAEGAAAAQNQLRQAGIASAYEATNQHIVYAGITPDRNSAILLSNQLEKMELETYVKPYERPVVRALQWGEASAGQIESYIADGAGLARTVSLLTLVHLEETELTNFEDATIEALTQSHQRWTMASRQISDHIPQAGEVSFERMNNELTTAVNSLQEYRKNPSTAYLWQAQTAVMNYIILEKHLLQQLAA